MEDYITFEQAVKLYELDFDMECSNGYYIHAWMDKPQFSAYCVCEEVAENYDGTYYYPAPTLSQAQKWLRECKDIIIGIDFDNWHYKYECHVYKRIGYSGENIRDTYGSQLVANEFHEDFDTYEQALSAGISKALELLRQ